jgi:hypothetical protein
MADEETFKKEAELQKLFIEAIDEDNLHGIIDDAAQLGAAAEDNRKNQFPEFSIDHLSRSAALSARHDVLEALLRNCSPPWLSGCQ